MNNSSLFDEKTFYSKFITDLQHCSNEVIIESPFITSNRMQSFYPVFYKLLARKVKIYVVTRRPEDHENPKLRVQSEQAVFNFERMGVQALLCRGNHHRKLAIIDRKILWEGSLNILSQTYSREIMTRTEEERYVDLKLATELLQVYAEKGADFLGQGLTVNLNTNSGYVFLSDEDYAVGVLNYKGTAIVQFYSCPECGYENTQEDAEVEEKDFVRFEGFCSKEC